jgi:hypothetical protein
MVLVLDEDVGADEVTQPGVGVQRRRTQVRADGVAGVPDVRERRNDPVGRGAQREGRAAARDGGAGVGQLGVTAPGEPYLGSGVIVTEQATGPAAHDE